MLLHDPMVCALLFVAVVAIKTKHLKKGAEVQFVWAILAGEERAKITTTLAIDLFTIGDLVA